MNDHEEIAGIGDNIPDPVEALQAELREKHAELFRRRDELVAAQERAPTECTDEGTKEALIDHIKMLAELRKNVEAVRVNEKEPHLKAGRAVDALFKPIVESMEKAAAAAKKPVTRYDEIKAEEERIRREEEARKAREEAERARREAEEAERKAREERERQERERREAEEKARREEEERLAKIKSEEDLQRAIEEEERQKREAEERERIAKREREQREREAEREARERAKAAEQAEREAAKAEKAAGAKDADMSRSRSGLGAVGSLTTKWVGEVTSIDDLDLEPLRHHINPEALEKAVRSYVRAGGRELRGARIYEDRSTTVR